MSLEIRILHPSARGHILGPYQGFGQHEVSHEQKHALESVAVETFTDMVSAGHTFQSALAAVYYTGIVHALETLEQAA